MKRIVILDALRELKELLPEGDKDNKSATADLAVSVLIDFFVQCGGWVSTLDEGSEDGEYLDFIGYPDDGVEIYDSGERVWLSGTRADSEVKEFLRA